jgi:hypothetical protein
MDLHQAVFMIHLSVGCVLRGLSPRANYADQATAARRRSYSQLLRIESVARSERRIPTAVLSVEWTPFQTHYFSENLVAPEIEPGPLDM